MIYVKNKNSFKKTTAKIDHSEARKNILSMIKQTVTQDEAVTPKSNDNENKECNREKSRSRQTLKRGMKEEKVNEFDLGGDKS